MVTLEDEMMTKTSKNKELNLNCIFCDFKTTKKYNYDIHLTTDKHKRMTNDYKGGQNQGEIKQNKQMICQNIDNKYRCNCGKEYKHRQGLWKHKKICNYKEDIEKISDNITSNFSISPELIVELIKAQIKNSDDLKQILSEQNDTIKTIVNNGIGNINNSVTQTNSHNKAFNLNLFLNETCKNAMNIMDFAESIKLNFNDLENIGELGYIEGISKIIIDNLKLLDITERPVHCSDFKRDVLYVKDNNSWEKENDANAKIKKLINTVANKNISLIPKWKKENPECANSDSIKSNKINKMIIEAMETDKMKQDKIIKKIAKEVIINKD